jgi:hypothetical protein
VKTDITNPEPQVSTLGGELSLLAPDPAMIHIDDIITALRNESRYGGHTTKRVSVLQHSVNVFLLAYVEGASCEDMRKALARRGRGLPERHPAPAEETSGRAVRRTRAPLRGRRWARSGRGPDKTTRKSSEMGH